MTNSPNDRVGGSHEAASPSPGADEQDDILRLVCRWEDALRHHLGYRAGTDAFHQADDRHEPACPEHGHGPRRGAVCACPIGVDPLATIQNAVDYLTGSGSWSRTGNWSALQAMGPDVLTEFGQGMLEVYRRAIHRVHNGSARVHHPVPCPTCGIVALAQEEGTPGHPWYVICLEAAGGCGRIFEEGEYELLAELLLDQHTGRRG